MTSLPHTIKALLGAALAVALLGACNKRPADQPQAPAATTPDSTAPAAPAPAPDGSTPPAGTTPPPQEPPPPPTRGQ